MAAAFRRRPPPRHPVFLLALFLVGVILVFDGLSVAVDIVASSSLTLTALRRPLVLSLRQLVVACPLSRHIVLRYRLVLSSRRLVVACRVASVAISCCAALSSSCRSRRLCRHIMLRRLLVLSSRRLVVACHVVTQLSCAALLSSRRAGWLLIVASPLSVAILSCATLSSSCHAG